MWQKLLSSALDVLPRYIHEINKNTGDKNSGGYFCVFTNDNLISPLGVLKIGEPPQEKQLKYFLLTQEKAQRLLSNPDHDSSWESRDVDINKFGGAIRTPDYVLSFSGLPEINDETLMIMFAFRLGMIPTSQVEKIIQFSGNQLVMSLLD